MRGNDVRPTVCTSPPRGYCRVYLPYPVNMEQIRSVSDSVEVGAVTPRKEPVDPSGGEAMVVDGNAVDRLFVRQAERC